MAMTVISVAFVNLAVSLTAARERGTLKRVRGTRLPPWVFMAGRIGTAIVVTAGTVVLVAVVAQLAYGVSIPTSTLGAGVLMLVLNGLIAWYGSYLRDMVPEKLREYRDAALAQL